MRNVLEKIVAGVLTCSGFVTSLTIVLIVLFLFSEALGLFGSKVIEEGYVLALNQENVVDELSPREIKDIFDEEITNWREVGGADCPIHLFRLEDVKSYFTEEEWRTRKKRDDEDGGSGLFLDHETKLTHGFVSIQCESEAQVL